MRHLTAWLPLLAVVGIVFAGLIGCTGGSSGPATEQVNGTLTINGQPANDVTISFIPLDAAQPTASGPVKDGKFQLFSGVEGKPGAGVGKYKVVLAVAAQAIGPENAESGAYGVGATGAPEQKLTFPQKYSSAATSDKEVEVKAGTNDITIEIEGE